MMSKLNQKELDEEKIIENSTNFFIKDFKMSLPLKPVITKKEEFINKKVYNKDGKNKLTSTSGKIQIIQRKISAKKEKMAIDCLLESHKKHINESKRTKPKTPKNTKYFNLSSLSVSRSGSLEKEEKVKESLNEQKFNMLVEEIKDKEYGEVRRFLEGVGLKDKYLHNFIKHNITTKEQIELLNENKLIKVLKIEDKNDISRIIEEVDTLRHTLNINVLDDNFGTGIQCDFIGTETVTNENDIEELEKRERILFQKAVAEFRNAGKREGNEDKIELDSEDKNKEKEVDCGDNLGGREEESESVKDPQHFLFNIGESNLFNFNTISLFCDKENDTAEDKKELPLLLQKKVCYFCLKIIDTETKKDYKILGGRMFCDENCLMKYSDKNCLKCDICSKKYLKVSSIFSDNKHFCSIKCFELSKIKIEEEENEEENEVRDTLKAQEENKGNRQNINDSSDIEIIDILDI